MNEKNYKTLSTAGRSIKICSVSVVPLQILPLLKTLYSAKAFYLVQIFCLARKHEQKIISSINFYHKKHFHRSECLNRAKTPGGATETEHILMLRPAVDKFL
jgi:hypothetical protein